MPAKRHRQPAEAFGEFDLTRLAALANGSFEQIEDDYKAKIETLNTQLSLYSMAFEKISQGVCLFDGKERLLLSNRRYAEIYRLSPDDIRPGTTLNDITERRYAVGTGPAGTKEAYLAKRHEIHKLTEPQSSTLVLKDGRSIAIYHQPMPDGGWLATHDDITERLDENFTLQMLIDCVPDYLWVKDKNSRFVMLNQALATDWGRPDPAAMIGLSDFDFHPAELAAAFFACEQEIMSTGRRFIGQEEYISDSKGAKKWISSTKMPLRNADGEIFRLVGIARDITASKLASELRNGQSRVLEMIATSAPLKEVLDCLMLLIDSQLTGIRSTVLLLSDDGLKLHTGSGPNLPESYMQAIDGVHIGPDVGSCGTAAYCRETVIVSDIMCDPLWVNYRDLAAEYGLRSCWSTPILSHDGSVLGAFAMYSNEVREPSTTETQLFELSTRIAGIAIERKKAERRIQHMANHDALTGLPNRTLLNGRMVEAINYASQHGRRVQVLFIDLDNFKLVNDSLGHNAGDRLLKTVAGRMVSCIGPKDSVVRLGGDEFVIILADLAKDEFASVQILQNIRTAIAEPIHLDEYNLIVTSSIGLATYPEDGTDSETLLANADAAMYSAKAAGRDNFQFYTPELNPNVHTKFKMKEELRHALARGELHLVYQPQIDLRCGRMFAVEALLRWKHSTLGNVSPAEFIPMAEETGIIGPIGDWVLRMACCQNKAWQNAGLPHMNICVNVSARQIKEKSWVASVVLALQESGLDARYLELELTESLIMQDVEQAIATMKQLQQQGIKLAIDDFGTGYSSLSALKNFPVTRLKIDKSFVSDIPDNKQDMSVVSAIIAMGHSLNLRVIAEGVETDEQVEFLRQSNCDEMQGYHFSKPLAARDIEQLLMAQKNNCPDETINHDWNFA